MGEGPNDNYSNNRANELANKGRESAQKFEMMTKNGWLTTQPYRTEQGYKHLKRNICTMHY